jgi:hypothetical protein
MKQLSKLVVIGQPGCPYVHPFPAKLEHENTRVVRERQRAFSLKILSTMLRMVTENASLALANYNNKRSDFSVRSLRQKSEVLFFFVSLLLRRRRWRLFGWLVSSANSFCLCSFFQLHRLARGERQKSPTSTTGHSA